MRGEILDFDPVASTGLISGDDGLRYSFVSASLQPGATVRSGQRVDFVAEDGVATQIMTLSSAAAPAAAMTGPDRGQPFDFATALFSFEGRLRRQNFWIGWLILLGVGVVLGWIPILGGLISLLLIWPNLAIGAKRLHDMGKSAWLIAVPWAVSIVGTIFAVFSMGMSAVMNAQALENDDPAAILGLMGPMFGLIALMILVNLGFLIWIGVTDSEPGDNRFGPNPKGL